MAKKYIDAEKLKELLDAKYKEFTEKAKKDCPLQYQYMADGLDIVEQFLDSLQQELSKLYKDESLGSPDYERGFKHGRDYQANVEQKYTKNKVISYLVDKGYPVSTNGEIPTYQETFDMINNAIKHANKQEQPEVDLKMVVRIDNIVMNMVGEGYNNGYKTRPFYEEVLQRLNARKEKNK